MGEEIGKRTFKTQNEAIYFMASSAYEVQQGVSQAVISPIEPAWQGQSASEVSLPTQVSNTVNLANRFPEVQCDCLLSTTKSAVVTSI